MSEVRVSKEGLMDALVRFDNQGREALKGQRVIARGLVYWLQRHSVPEHELLGIWYKIPEVVVNACQELLYLETPVAQEFRRDFARETGYPFLDVISVYQVTQSEIDRTSTVDAIAGLITTVTGWPELGSLTEVMLNAEVYATRQKLYLLAETVYRGGLDKIVSDAPSGVVTGTFGNTSLSTLQSEEGLTIFLARADDDGSSNAAILLPASIGEGYGARLVTCYAKLYQLLAMIDEVIDRWPAEEARQRLFLFVGNPARTN